MVLGRKPIIMAKSVGEFSTARIHPKHKYIYLSKFATLFGNIYAGTRPYICSICVKGLDAAKVLKKIFCSVY